jgi:hypothetical protein
MAVATKTRTSRDRTRAYRERLRGRGLKPVTLWLPDIDEPNVRAEIERGCRLLDQSDDERDVLALIDSLVDEQLRELDEYEKG